MAELGEEVVRFITQDAPLGHVVTIGPDGAPDVSVAWFDVTDAGRLVFATLFDQRKLGNLRRDPRVTVSFEATSTNAVGMRHYLVVDGTAEVREGGAPELLAALAKRYVDPDAQFPPMPDPPPGFITHVTPVRLRGIGRWSG